MAHCWGKNGEKPSLGKCGHWTYQTKNFILNIPKELKEIMVKELKEIRRTVYEWKTSVWYEAGVQLYSFACVSPVFPASFIEEIVLFSDYMVCSGECSMC